MADWKNTIKEARVPVILLGVLVVIFFITLYNPPAGRISWLLEVGPALMGIIILIITYKKFPMSHFVYWCVFLHTLILVYGGFYTYAETPLGNWLMEIFNFSRNHYDRIGHLALGFFPTFIVREVLLRKTKLEKNGWLFFIIVSVVVAIGAVWELLEWWTTLIVASDVGTAFLGTQGDVWDAQWDIFLAMVGSIIALLILSKKHEKSMEAGSR